MILNRSTRGLANRLLRLNGDDLALALAHIANEAKIPTATFARARTKLPSFSAAKWSKYAQQFGLPPYVSELQFSRFDTFKTPSYHLPPSLHTGFFKNSWLWQEVYHTSPFEETEAGLRLLDPYIVPLAALFQGRVVDWPLFTAQESKYSAGNEVEHMFSMHDGTIFIIRLDLGLPDASHIARLFLDLASVAELNLNAHGNRRIYGLSTNLSQYRFFSYDPAGSKFYDDDWIFVDTTNRKQWLSDMMKVTNKIFGVILSAYIDGLRVIITRIKEKEAQEDPSRVQAGQSRPALKSSKQYEAALTLAENCRAKFEEPGASFQEVETKGNEALELLAESVRSIPHASMFVDKVEEFSKASELEELATRVTRETHKRRM